MANTKTYETVFALAAKYTGSAAFAALNRDVDKTEKNVKNAHASFGKMFTAVTGGVIAAVASLRLFGKAFHEVQEFSRFAFDAAKDQKKAHYTVRQSYQKLVQQGRLRASDLDSEIAKTIKLSETMAETGIDAEVLEVGLAGLSKFYGSNDINKMAKGYQDWLVTLSKGEPHLENVAEFQQKMSAWIMKGKGQVLMETGMSKEDVDAINKHLKSLPAAQRATERAAIAMKHFGKETGATARWLQTDEGIAFKAANKFEDLGETVGGPMVQAQRDFNIAMLQVYKALQPVADLIANQLKPRMDDISKWLADHKEDIAAWAKAGAGAFFWLYDKLVVSLDDTKKQWDLFWPYLKGGWDNFWKSIEDTKAQWTAMVTWIDDNFIKPIYDKFIWLINQITEGWDKVKGILKSVGLIDQASNATPGTAGEAARRASEGRANAAGAAAGEQPAGSGWGTPMNPTISQISGSPVHGALGGVLAGKEGVFEAAGAKHGVDPKLLMAIAEFETGHGSSYSARNRNNIAGIMNPRDPSKHMVYGSIEEGIEAQAALLKRGYISKGLTSIPQIGAKYSPPGASNDPNRTNSEWPASVQREYNRISKLQSSATSAAAGSGAMESAMMRLPGGPGSSLNKNIREMNTRQKVEGGLGASNIAMGAPNITINAPGADPAAIAMHVKGAMRDSSREFLSTAKKARDDEARLGYV